MKSYDYKKAKQLIEENKQSLLKACLGMHEDWLYTSETVWENGQFQRALPDNAVELDKALLEKMKNGLSMFEGENDSGELNPVYKRMAAYKIKKIFSSSWATPTLQLVYKSGEDKMIPCYISDGEEIDFGEKVQQQIKATSGSFSSKVQEDITPLEKPKE